jgi:murein DD-endopeptidase MepM/ murein hydrolase activator NlpD
MKKLVLGMLLLIYTLTVSVLPVRAQVSPPLFLVPVPYRYISTYYSSWHPGVDLVAPCYTSVIASKAGKIVYSGWDGTGYGNRIDVDNGIDKAKYAHLSVIGVSNGQSVDKGQYIGKVGSTGRSTGCHLHFELAWKGQSVNPLTSLGH